MAYWDIAIAHGQYLWHDIGQVVSDSHKISMKYKPFCGRLEGIYNAVKHIIITAINCDKLI